MVAGNMYSIPDASDEARPMIVMKTRRNAKYLVVAGDVPERISNFGAILRTQLNGDRQCGEDRENSQRVLYALCRST
jgi:hypothetical protein